MCRNDKSKNTSTHCATESLDDSLYPGCGGVHQISSPLVQKTGGASAKEQQLMNIGQQDVRVQVLSESPSVKTNYLSLARSRSAEVTISYGSVLGRSTIDLQTICSLYTIIHILSTCKVKMAFPWGSLMQMIRLEIYTRVSDPRSTTRVQAMENSS